MSDKFHHKIPLELKVEKFFEHDSELSDSDESLERTRSSSHSKRKGNHQNGNDKTIVHKRTVKKLRPREISHSDSRTSTRNLNSKERISIPIERDSFRMTSPHSIGSPSNVASMKDNYALRMKIAELGKTLSKKNRQIRKLYDDIYAEKEEIRQLTITADALSRKSSQIEIVQDKLSYMQKKELQLMHELTSQQKMTKNALSKLQELQELSLKEIETAKNYYKDFYAQQTEEIKAQLENKIAMLTKEKEALLSTIKTVETTKEREKTNEVSLLNEKIESLKDELEATRAENSELALKLDEQEEAHAVEKEALEARIEELLHNNKLQRSHEKENHARDVKEKEKLYEKIDSLENQLLQKNKSIVSRDKEYKDQLELINSKLDAFQKEVKKVGEYEMKIETLQQELLAKEDELELARQYYREKLTENKKAQNQQKLEWSTIYSELLEEIKNLQSENELLDSENRKLLASITNYQRKC